MKISQTDTVACPGLLFPRTAVGTPAGGTYKWSIVAQGPAGVAQDATVPPADLVDNNYSHKDSGNQVNLIGFRANSVIGMIPPQNVMISVEYTYTDGRKDVAQQSITVHAVNFNVSDSSLRAGAITAEDGPNGLDVANWAAGGSEIKAEATVQIKLDPSCPQPQKCAANHEVGWVQKVPKSKATVHLEYDHSKYPITNDDADLPDSLNKNPPFTFYSDSDIKQFELDKGAKTQLKDSPGFTIRWTNKAGDGLSHVRYHIYLSTWLAARNIGAAKWVHTRVSPNDPVQDRFVEHAMVFLANFKWDMAAAYRVNSAIPKSFEEMTQLNVPPQMSHGIGDDPKPVVPRMLKFNQWTIAMLKDI